MPERGCIVLEPGEREVELATGTRSPPVHSVLPHLVHESHLSIALLLHVAELDEKFGLILFVALFARLRSRWLWRRDHQVVAHPSFVVRIVLAPLLKHAQVPLVIARILHLLSRREVDLTGAFPAGVNLFLRSILVVGCLLRFLQL